MSLKSISAQGKPIVEQGYDRIARRYRSWSKDNSTRQRFLRETLARLAPGSSVIELGCGAAEPVTRTLAERHDVIAVDLSREQLRLARDAAPRATFIAADMTEVDFPPASVDAVVAFFVFGHLPPAEHGPLLAKAAAWLRPGGFLLFSTPVDAADGMELDWLGVPMYFGGIGTTATFTAVDHSGLTVERAEVVEEREHGHVAEFLWIVAERPAAHPR